MADLKDMTLQALRDLARKALGRGHSKIRKKSEIIEALQAAEKKVEEAAGKAAFRTMFQDGVAKVTAGITTLEEVRRVI